MAKFKIYPGAGHGFFADYRQSYRADVAQDAWTTMQAWFKKYDVLDDGLASSQPGQACRRENAGTGNPLMLPKRGARKRTKVLERTDHLQADFPKSANPDWTIPQGFERYSEAEHRTRGLSQSPRPFASATAKACLQSSLKAPHSGQSTIVAHRKLAAIRRLLAIGLHHL